MWRREEVIAAMPTLHIRLLGDFSLVFDDRPVPSLTSPRLQSLFAYLALHREVAQQRRHLAFLFWPDASEAQARNNLRQLVHQARLAFPEVERLLQLDASSISWRADIVMELDVAVFEAALARASEAERRHDTPARQAALEAADALYRGALVPSCYDDWIAPERDRLRHAHQQALAQLLHLAEGHIDHESAIRYAQRLLQLDPFSEDLTRRLMHLHVANHDRASALHVYHHTVATLQRELGVEPDSATRAAYEHVMRQDSGAPTAAETPAFAASSALIGREREWEGLHAAWQRTTTEGPHFVLVAGEAGIGKSRLAEDFLLWARQQGAITATTRSYAVEGQLGLLPVAEWLRSAGLRRPLDRLDPVLIAEVARIVPELLTGRADVPSAAPITDLGQRQRFFEALARAVLASSRPVVLVLDDLQWCDADTLEWLHLLLRHDQAARLLVIGCVRSEELAPTHPLKPLLLQLHQASGVTELALERLDAAATGQLAEQVTRRGLDTAATASLYHETGGIPLFVVELLRAEQGQARDSAPGSVGPPWPHQFGVGRTLPARVQAVLSGRLRQLSPEARAFASLAATVGRAFSVELLQAAGQADADSTVRALDELWHRRIVREDGAANYDFTHDKLREVAYAETSVPHRRQQHRHVAEALESLHKDDLDPYCGQIATHYERAGLLEQALPNYQRAAAVAQRLFANDEALGLLARGLELLKELPEGVNRDQQELRLQLALLPLYRMAKGWASTDLGDLLNRIQELCATVGDDMQRALALYGLQSVYSLQARFDDVFRITDELTAHCQRTFGIAPPFGQVMVGGVRGYMGQFAAARVICEEIFATDVPAPFLQVQAAQGVNLLALARAVFAHLLWCLGYPEQALTSMHAAARLVQQPPQPFNQAQMSVFLATLHQLGADAASAGAAAVDALALAERNQAPYYRAWAAILVRHAEALAQPDAAHIAHLRAAITEFHDSNARLRLPYFRALLADACLHAGRAEEGLAALDGAFAIAVAQHEHWWDAELYRLRGELLQVRGAPPAEVEAALLRAVEIAREQEARSFELRATLSLARVWSAMDRAQQARERLAAVYAWFTEGFDSPDLQAAKRLLDQL
jgi:DNA-binding SARP family transcriptional activator